MHIGFIDTFEFSVAIACECNCQVLKSSSNIAIIKITTSIIIIEFEMDLYFFNQNTQNEIFVLKQVFLTFSAFLLVLSWQYLNVINLADHKKVSLIICQFEKTTIKIN